METLEQYRMRIGLFSGSSGSRRRKQKSSQRCGNTKKLNGKGKMGTRLKTPNTMNVNHRSVCKTPVRFRTVMLFALSIILCFGYIGNWNPMFLETVDTSPHRYLILKSQGDSNLHYLENKMCRFSYLKMTPAISQTVKNGTQFIYGTRFGSDYFQLDTNYDFQKKEKLKLFRYKLMKTNNSLHNDAAWDFSLIRGVEDFHLSEKRKRFRVTTYGDEFCLRDVVFKCATPKHSYHHGHECLSIGQTQTCVRCYTFIHELDLSLNEIQWKYSLNNRSHLFHIDEKQKRFRVNAGVYAVDVNSLYVTSKHDGGYVHLHTGKTRLRLNMKPEDFCRYRIECMHNESVSPCGFAAENNEKINLVICSTGKRSRLHDFQIGFNTYLHYSLCIYDSTTLLECNVPLNRNMNRTVGSPDLLLHSCNTPGTCCFLIGNKGMHCYNGNPRTGQVLNINTETNNKERFSVLLIDGGCKALRYTISRIVLDISLQNMDQATKGSLAQNVRDCLFPRDAVLPLLDGLIQSDLDIVWTKALKCPVKPAITRGDIYEYLVGHGFDIQLKRNKQKLSALNNTKQILSQTQWSKLYPPNNTTVDIHGFDPTLLCFVILNMFERIPTSGSYQMPQNGDIEIGDDIIRLRMHRNVLAHDSPFAMDNNIFETKWNEVSAVLIRLMGQEFAAECKRLYRCPIDPVQAAHCQQLSNEWERSENGIFRLRKDFKAVKRKLNVLAKDSKKIKLALEDGNNQGLCKNKRPTDVMCDTVAAWEEKDKLCYHTKGVLSTLTSIQSCHSLCVIGVPGSGKSTAIIHAAMELKNNGYTIYNIENPEEFERFYDKNYCQVFVVEDILGIHSVSKQKLEIWERFDEKVRNSLNDKTKMLCSLRIQLYKDRSVKVKRFHFLSSIVDLSVEKLSKDEMKGMLKHYIAKSGLQETIDDWSDCINIEEFSDCFPLLCKVFCNEKHLSKNAKQFFTHPFPALSNIFENMQTENKVLFCALTLCAFYNGELTDKCFCTLNELSDNMSPIKRKAILSKHGLKCPDHLERIKNALKTVVGVYVTKIGPRYKISHQVFYDIVTYLYGDAWFVCEYGSSEFITERVRIEKTLPADDKYVLVFQSDEIIDRLTTRFMHELESNLDRGVTFIFNYPQIDTDDLISDLRLKFQNSNHKIDSIFHQCMNELFKAWGSYRYGGDDVVIPQYKLIKLLLDLKANCNYVITLHSHWWLQPYEKAYPIHICIATGSLKLTELLLHSGADPKKSFNDKDNNLKLSTLQFTCKHAKYNTIKLIKLMINDRDQSMIECIETFAQDDLLKPKDNVTNSGQESERIIHTYLDEYDHVQFSNDYSTFKLKDEAVTKLRKCMRKGELYEFHRTRNQFIHLHKILHKNWLQYFDDKGMTLTHYAARYSDDTVIQYISALTHFTHFDICDRKRRSVLHCAVSNSNCKLESIQYICCLSQFKLINHCDDSGRSVLHYAIENCSLEVIQYLCSLEQFTQINHCDNEGRSVLHYALEYHCKIEVIQYLCSLEQFTQINHSDNEGRSVLHYALEYHCKIEVIQYLCSLEQFTQRNHCDNEGRSVLHYAVEYHCKIEVIQYLCSLEQFTQINHCDNEGRSVLHYAVEYAEYVDMDVIQYLCNLQQFAMLNRCDSQLRSVLHSAVKKYNCELEVVEYFCNLPKFTQLNRCDVLGKSVLHLAVENMYCGIDVIKYLCNLPHFTRLNSIDSDGKSVLHCAVEHMFDEDIIEYLCELPTFTLINHCDYEGMSVLHYAVNDTMSIVTKLYVIEYLCNHTKFTAINECDIYGKSVLHYALDNEDLGVEVIRYLCELPQFTLINHRDDNDETVLDFAKDRENYRFEILQYLNSLPHFTQENLCDD